MVDDEPAVAHATERLLARQGYRVIVADGGRKAIEAAATTPFDAIISDLAMPDMDGRALLRAVRARDLDVPFIFLTGSPDLESAMDAIEYGAFRYLIKPASPGELLRVLGQAVSWRRLALIRRGATQELEGRTIGDRAGLEARFASALEKLWIATQPIVSWETRSVLAYETLVRTEEVTLRSPIDLLDAAERLGRTQELGRAIRRLVAKIAPDAPESTLLFVNLHPSDLEDDDLASPDGVLSRFSKRVILEITERAALDGIRGLPRRIERLRELGFRIAIDDLGAGYAGLSSVAALEPDVIKADMSLVRGIEQSPTKQKVLATVAALTTDLGIQLVAEGIETPNERDCVVSLGAPALQGYLFARPARGFPTVSY